MTHAARRAVGPVARWRALAWAVARAVAILALAAIPAGGTEADADSADRERTSVPQGRGAVEFFELKTLDTEGDAPLLSDEAVPYPATAAERPRPLLEIGNRFLGRGPIRRGIKTPAGQMLQPWLLLFGEMRTALQVYEDGDRTTSEWANRIELNANLNLSGTERVVATLRPIDRENGKFTGYSIGPSGDRGWMEEFNAKLEHLFFEGDFGQIFRALDPADRLTLDYGFAVGRQPLSVQDGVLVSDIVDAVGVTRNSLTLEGVPNLRITGIFGWNGVNRADNFDESSARLFGLLSRADTAWDTTTSADLLFVLDTHGETSGWYLGVGTTQRLGSINTTFRVAGSIPMKESSGEVSGGALLMAELSRTLPNSDDVVYLNSFWSIGKFSSAARGRDQGTPVSGLGILWGPVGMGRYGVPLGQSIDNTAGAALGFQGFHSGIRGQLTLEVGARIRTTRGDEGVFGVGARYQRAFGQHGLMRLDGSVAVQHGNGPSYGARLEWIFRL